jgi:cell division protein FtsN
MKIEGTAPTQGPDGRRFSAAKSAPPKEGGKSFGALLKKAAEGKTSSAAPTAPPATSPAPAAKTAAAPAPEPTQAETKAPAAAAADAPESFANHMEMVKLRLKSGYYNNTKVDDALSEKLTGFFDDLA